ncbi:MAG: hypothetical protein LBD64_08250 [Odoribacteraceae bacterium]|jgi:hypothetical protein|nr:hypothetical protein [Odoribacteraceae bacterium]
MASKKIKHYLLVLAAFLIAASSAVTLHETGYGTSKEFPVYINIAAMLAIAIAVSIKKKKTNV